MDTATFIAPLLFSSDEFLLRPYQPGDGPELCTATTSSYEHLRPWMLWATSRDTAEAAEVRCRRIAARYLLSEDFTLGIWVGDQLAGGTGFHLRGVPLANQSAEIGMWIRGSYAGQGLGTRVLGAMLKWGFEEWGWQRLIWQCDTRNLASASVARKNGLLLEATLRSDALDIEGGRRDTHVFALLRDQWLGRNR